MKAPRSASELLKEVLAGATRALAAEPDLAVTFAADPSNAARTGEDRHEVRLPAPHAARMTPPDLAWLRGEADRLACRRRFHDEAVHRRRTPRDPQAAAVFDVLER
ncbi:MAG: cobaltochelatase subunit CobT, partial [Alphaproteobacteria bacterium]